MLGSMFEPASKRSRGSKRAAQPTDREAKHARPLPELVLTSNHTHAQNARRRTPQPHTQTHIHIPTHARTHTHTHIHTRTPTYTHAPPPPHIRSFSETLAKVEKLRRLRIDKFSHFSQRKTPVEDRQLDQPRRQAVIRTTVSWFMLGSSNVLSQLLQHCPCTKKKF